MRKGKKFRKAALRQSCRERFLPPESAVGRRLFRGLRGANQGPGQQLDGGAVADIAPHQIKAGVKVDSHKTAKAQARRMGAFMDRCTYDADTHARRDECKPHRFQRDLLRDARLDSNRDAGGNDPVKSDTVKFAREAKYRIFGEFRNADLILVAQRVLGGHDNEAVKRPYPLGYQPRLTHIALNQRNVDLTTAQMMEHISSTSHDLDDDFYIIRDLAKGGESFTNETQLTRDAGHADTDSAGPARRIARQMCLGVRNAFKNEPSVLEQDFAGREQLGAARQAEKERRPDLFLQLMNSTGKSRLGNVKDICCPLKAALFRDSHKIMKSSKIQESLHNYNISHIS